MKLSELRENPNNPSSATEAELERLAAKLKRVPLGLTAMRIAYVTDDPAGGKMVISGNKRLRVLKRAYGNDAELPDEYFQDVTKMSEAERHEFIITANISDGHWDVDKLIEQYDKEELNDLIGEDELNKLLESLDEEQADETVEFNENNPTQEEYDSLKERYITAPFSILRGYSGTWQKRKKLWKKFIPVQGSTRENCLYNRENLFTQTCGTVSMFDPVLAEIMQKWYCVPSGSIFDTFAGDTLKGLVFSMCGHKFRGIELRPEQVAENSNVIEKIKKNYNDKIDIEYYCDDGQNVFEHFEKNSFDMYFSCPPYYNLEVYSDKANDASNQATYDDFLKILETSFKKAIEVLKDDSFAVIVVGDVRDKQGFYYDFPGDVKKIFIKNGCRLYNDIIYAQPLGNACMLCQHLMKSRKTVKIHQNVLVFYKGNPANISKKFPEIKYADKNIQEFLEIFEFQTDVEKTSE